MMSDVLEREVGIYRVWLGTAQCELVWDKRQECLTFQLAFSKTQAQETARQQQETRFDGQSTPSRKIVEVQLISFTSFEYDLRALGEDYKQTLITILQDIIGSRANLPSDQWREALGRFAFLLLRFSLKRDTNSYESAVNLLKWLGPDSDETLWRVRYDDNLSFERRYHLIAAAKISLPDPNNWHSQLSPSTLTYKKTRELSWWTKRCQYDLAYEWHESEGDWNIVARDALRESSLAYLQLLKDEPRRQELEQFLWECGSSIEKEVRKVFSIKKNFLWEWGGWIKSWLTGHSKKSGPLRTSGKDDENLLADEVVHHIFFAWFLKRYDLTSAKKLALSSCRKRERVVWRVSFILLLVALALFLVPILWPSALQLQISLFRLSVPTIWLLQISAQLSFLLMIFLGAQTLSNLLMPRALFGSLLAWLTIIITGIPSMQQIKVNTGNMTLQQVCHACLTDHPKLSLLLGCLPFLLLSSIFVINEVNSQIRRSIMGLRRTFAAMLRFILGALFWGMIFSLPIKILLESQPDPQCVCTLQIALIGGSLAVLLGIIVQLLWEDKSITEPIKEPL